MGAVSLFFGGSVVFCVRGRILPGEVVRFWIIGPVQTVIVTLIKVSLTKYKLRKKSEIIT